MARSEAVPGTSVQAGTPPVPRDDAPARPGRLAVSELALGHAGGPSPFGDDVEFPLPVEKLRYTPTTTP